MFSPRFIAPVAVALATLASPAHAAFTQSSSGATTTLTENFNGSNSAFTGNAVAFSSNDSGIYDGAVWLQGGGSAMSTTFTAATELATLNLDFWYTGCLYADGQCGTDGGPVGTVTLSDAGGTSRTISLAAAGGLNPGAGSAGTNFVTTFYNLSAGTYTVSFAQLGYNQVKVDDFSLGMTAAVPEPSTIALMLAGLSFVGFAASRKKRPL